MNAQTKLQPSGEVMIPQALRDAKNWSPGTELEAIDTPEGVLLRPKAVPRRTISVDEFLKRVPRHNGSSISIEEMDAAVSRMFAERGKDV